MEQRHLPHGNACENLSVLGIGAAGLTQISERDIEAVFHKALEHGVNYFEMCAGNAKIYAPFGRAIAQCRKEVFFELHFGAIYDQNGDYGWSRDLDEIQKTFDWEMKTLHTDYVDFGFLHCIDTYDDYETLVSHGVLDKILELKKQGVVRHIGFSSHTPAVASKILDTGLIDLMLFSINPAYDLEKPGEHAYAIDSCGDTLSRMALYQKCEAMGVGITVMKPFHGGGLLDREASPLGIALTHAQCLQYALDRPGVLSVCPGVRNLQDLDTVLHFLSASPDEKDYACIANATPQSALGHCVYCNHCKPCPAGIDIGLVNKYYDLALNGDAMAANHYAKLTVNASKCLQCGHCDYRCPFLVRQSERMAQIARHFGH